MDRWQVDRGEEWIGVHTCFDYTSVSWMGVDP